MTLASSQDPQFIQLTVKGLFTMPNSLSEVPKGSLLNAKNTVVDYDGLLTVRRGIKQYGISLETLTSNVNTEVFQEFFYKGSKMVWFGDSTAAVNSSDRSYFAYDSDGLGDWALTTHPFPAPAYALTDTYRTAQSNDNIYLTSSRGILKTDDPAHALYSAGGAPGLDGIATLVDSSGFMPDNSQVAYRMTWTYTDSNNNDVEGTPSTRLIIANASGHDSNVTLVYTIPHEVTTAYQWKIFRTLTSASNTTDPGDEEQQVLDGFPNSTDITNGFFTVKDTVPQSQVGAFLYTNANSGQGISQANNIPPLANDICFFFGYLIYGGATTQQKFLCSLLSAEPALGIQVGDTITVSNGTISFTLTGASSENVSLSHFKVFTGGDPGSDILNTKESIIRVMNRVASNTLVYAYDASDSPTGVALPGDFYLQEQGIGGGPFFMTSSRTTCWNPVLAACVVFSLTTITLNVLEVSSTSGVSNGDTIAQNGYVTTVLAVTDSTHLIVADSTGFIIGLNVVDISTGEPSAVGGGKGSGYCSKFQEPEAVPTANTISVGNPNFEWLRVLPLRNSAIVMKADGLFQLTGTTFPFTVTTLDTGTILTAPESPAVLNNQVYAYTNQGCVAIAETGPAIISRPIENVLQRISSYLYQDFPAVTFGTAYETDRKYLLTTISATDDFTRGTIQYVYDTITESWTTYVYPVAIWDLLESPTEHRLYAAAASTTYPYLFQERKTFTVTDYADIELPAHIVSFDNSNPNQYIVTLSSTANVVPGWSLAQLDIGPQGQQSAILNISVIKEVLNGTQIVVTDALTWDLVGLSQTRLEQPIPVDVLYCPITGTGNGTAYGNPGIIKFFKEIQFFFQQVDFDFVTVQFGTDFAPVGSAIDLKPILNLTGWGQFAWGEVPWGGTPDVSVQSIRTYIPLQARRAHWLNIEISLNQAMTRFVYGGCVLQYTDTTTRSK